MMTTGNGDADELMILHGIGGDAKTLDVWKYLDNMDRIGVG